MENKVELQAGFTIKRCPIVDLAQKRKPSEFGCREWYQATSTAGVKFCLVDVDGAEL
jgi:hypothetical protein